MSALPIGPLVNAAAAPRPSRVSLAGQYVDVVPLDAAAHGAALFERIGRPEHVELWTYMLDGPFADRAAFDSGMQRVIASEDPLYYAIVDKSSAAAAGRAALMRIEPAHRVIEVGGIVYSADLQRTRGATEAMYLLARYVFDTLGYRRYEWKCNALNAPSRAAALRLGFAFEGVFREHMIVKGRSRDTAWYSMLQSEWPARKARFERWLSPENFDESGRQRTALGDL